MLPAAAALVAAAGAGGSLPPAASGLRCDATAAGSTFITVQALVDAAAVDYLSLELWYANDTRQWPFMHYTAPVGPGGQVRARVPGLHPGTSYAVAARSHRRGWAEDGGEQTWSPLAVAADPCSTGAAAPEGPPEELPAAAPAGRPATHWLEVYRVAEEGNVLPDFLDNHDCGTLAGDTGFISGCSLKCHFFNWTGRVPITRYCVEVLNTTISNVTTSTFSGTPVDAPYADYKSCNRAATADPVDYHCLCDNLIDRTIAHQSTEQVLRECPNYPSNITGPGTPCVCSDASAASGAKYVGMMPVGLPMYYDYLHPGNFTGKSKVLGAWYSMPYGGRCPHGAPVGTGGCTWQRSPLGFSIYTRDLDSLGWNTTGASKAGTQDVAETLQNVAVIQKAFRALRMPPCGG